MTSDLTRNIFPQNLRGVSLDVRSRHQTFEFRCEHSFLYTGNVK